MTQRSSVFLMANLGSEVSRLYKALNANTTEKAAESSTRALHIINELLVNPQIQGRTAEVHILKDIIEDASAMTCKYDVKGKDLEAYFMPFAMRTLQGSHEKTEPKDPVFSSMLRG